MISKKQTWKSLIDEALEKNKDSLSASDGKASCWIEGKQTNSLLWTFTLEIKRRATNENMDVEQSWKKVSEIINEIGGWPYYIEDELDGKGWEIDMLELEFYTNWGDIKHGEGILYKAYDNMRYYNYPASIKKKRPKKYNEFIRFILALSAFKKEFLLPREKLGKLLGHSAMYITSFVKWAIEDGIIIETKKYIAHKKASEYKLVKDLKKIEKKKPRKKNKRLKISKYSKPITKISYKERPQIINGILYLPGEL